MIGKVSLTEEEVRIAVAEGNRREDIALKKRLHNSHGLEGHNSRAMHIQGSKGEKALSKFLGIPWSGGEFGGPDVGGFEVRAPATHNRRLILRKPDLYKKPEKVFFLVTGTPAEYRIQGFVRCRTGTEVGVWTNFGNGREWVWAVDRKLLDKDLSLLDFKIFDYKEAVDAEAEQ